MKWIPCSRLLDYDLEKVYVVDTETTGLDPSVDDVLQVSVTDLNGRCLFNRFFDSYLVEWPAASEVNHITPDMVADRPTLKGSIEREELEDVLEGAAVLVGYNLPFDVAFLQRAGVELPDVPYCDVMRDAMAVNDVWVLRRVSLKTMCDRYNCSPPLFHDSLNDCQATADVALNIASEPATIQHKVDMYHAALNYSGTSGVNAYERRI